MTPVVGAGEPLALSGSGFAANQVLGIGRFDPPVVLASVTTATATTTRTTVPSSR